MLLVVLLPSTLTLHAAAPTAHCTDPRIHNRHHRPHHTTTPQSHYRLAKDHTDHNPYTHHAHTQRNTPRNARRPPPHMQIGTTQQDTWDEFLGTDASTGERKLLNLDEKEKLYLDCLDAFYNGGPQPLDVEAYNQLKNDLSFQGSQIAGFSKDEVKFIVANKRFRAGTPVLSDPEYDALRKKLKAAGSPVVLHDAPSCSTTTGECKLDLRQNPGTQRLLYIPGFTIGLLTVCEACFWTIGTDPLLSVVIGTIPAYFFSIWFTENIFAQKPLVATANCPTCEAPTPVFFGDLFAVMTDGLAGPPAPPTDVVTLKCAVCKVDLTADRSKMIMTGEPKK